MGLVPTGAAEFTLPAELHPSEATSPTTAASATRPAAPDSSDLSYSTKAAHSISLVRKEATEHEGRLLIPGTCGGGTQETSSSNTGAKTDVLGES